MWRNKTIIIKVGVWKSGQSLECVWFDLAHHAQVFYSTVEHLSEIEKHILSHFPPKTSIQLMFISAISPHQIWTKNILLPQSFSSLECEQQCCFLLAQELDIPLSELWFDYSQKTVKQGCQLTVFAIQKAIAQQYLAPLSKLNIEVLDNLAHAILRGLQFLAYEIEQQSQLFLYQDESGCIALLEKRQQLYVLQQRSSNLMTLYEQFCTRFNEEPDCVFVYQRTPTVSMLPGNWREIHSDLPVIALGNALWGQDTASLMKE